MDTNGSNRKTLRLGEYDYSWNGTYFVTICMSDRQDFFGEIRNGIMGLNEMGDIAARFWSEIPLHFANVELGEWVAMPNHLHGVLTIDNQFENTIPVLSGDVVVGDANLRPQQRKRDLDRSKMLLPKIIQAFKAAVTRGARRINPHSPFGWQRSYYDHIIRNDGSLDCICDYIRNNPKKWSEDFESRENHFSEDDIKTHYDPLFTDPY
jgi:REP element-mobilizing transposase RayT